MKNSKHFFMVVVALLLFATDAFSFDSKIGWNIPTTGKLPDFYQICYSETYAGLINKEHCTSVGYNIESALGKVTGTLYNLVSTKSYFVAVVGCDTVECSPLSESIYYDGSPTTTYGFSFDLDMDGTPDRLKKNASGVIMYDLSSNGFNEGLTWDGVLSGNYGDASFAPIANIDDDGDGKMDLAFQNASGDTYIDRSSNGFNGWDTALIANKFDPYTKWIAGHGTNSASQFLADANGDGKSDAIIFFGDTGDWYVSLSNGTIFLPYTKWISAHGKGSNKQMMADVNGDGRADAVIWFSTTGDWYVAKSH